jgi:hypothetical protein
MAAWQRQNAAWAAKHATWTTGLSDRAKSPATWLLAIIDVVRGDIVDVFRQVAPLDSQRNVELCNLFTLQHAHGRAARSILLLDGPRYAYNSTAAENTDNVHADACVVGGAHHFAERNQPLL